MDNTQDHLAGDSRKALFKYILLALGLFSFFSLYGCATPTATLNPDATVETPLSEYKLVYLVKPEEGKDPRNIFPQVRVRLEDMGFDVRPVGPDDPPEGAQGSGFVIDTDGDILTCAHIFEKEKKASVWIKGKRYEADVVAKDEDNDLALLKITGNEKPGVKPLPIAVSPEYKMGEDVYTIGFPLSDLLGNSPRLNKGLVSSAVGEKDNPDHLQVSVETQPGNSGSPLLNKDGQVIGIMQSTLNPMNVLARTGGNLPQNVNFAAKANILRDFIKEKGEGITLASGQNGQMAFDQVSESVAQIRAGIITDEFLKQPKLVCFVAYISFWDMWFRFRVFHIEFYDYDSGEQLLKAGQYGDNALSTEGKVLDETFKQIREKFAQSAAGKQP